MQDYILLRVDVSDSLIDLLEQNACMVLLGGPGSGKSTSTRHLAWSHAVANLSNSTSLTNAPLLSGRPLPLRIELRRLNEDRKQRPDYDFLTYASEVLLGRAGLNVPPQMFELLLERRTLLVLFDGLDEVATLDDRRTLVEEIDSFAQRYPGNRFLITSRPVGYNLASLSTQTFCKAQVQPFDDGQIHQFLENWYAHVLRLSPLSLDDRQELEELYTNLKNNPRLHALAENPLLLTVITALHRYERLPDKRILVYDRCADLLLETWARLKGTNTRWQDLLLSKEDQYACVAHLGFVLHERSQQESNAKTKRTRTQSNGDLANDVPSRFMLREIERFLQHQNLFPSLAEQNKQASRFLELIKEEAGLIVERGTDENGESLYGFVHRTFQEYFAAADVYERYQQEEEADVISNFLREHLHDPHWNEVVLLLLGKLKRGPATKQLRQILEGTLQSHLSAYNDIVQQNLFFVSSCLTKEISVENDLAISLINKLSGLVQSSSFSSQRTQALETLDALMQTRQYALQVRQELKMFVAQSLGADDQTKLEAATILFRQSDSNSEDRHLAERALLVLFQRSNLSVDRFIDAARDLYLHSAERSEEKQFVRRLLVQMVWRADLPVEQTIEAALILYQFSDEESEEQKLASRLVLKPTLRDDMRTEQYIKLVEQLYRLAAEGSDVQLNAVEVLGNLAQCRDLSVEQNHLAAFCLYRSSYERPENIRFATKLMIDLARRENLLAEQITLIARTLSLMGSEERQQAVDMLSNLTQRADLTVEQIIDMAESFAYLSKPESGEQQRAIEMLLSLKQRNDLTLGQIVKIALRLYEYSTAKSEVRRQATDTLLTFAQHRDLPMELFIRNAWTLSRFSSVGSEERKLLVQLIFQMVKNQNFTTDQRLLSIANLFSKAETSSKGYNIFSVRLQAMEIAFSLLQEADIKRYFEKYWKRIEQPIELVESDVPMLDRFAREERLPIQLRNEMYQLLCQMVP